MDWHALLGLPLPMAQEKLRQAGVEAEIAYSLSLIHILRLYTVIYNAIEDMEKAMKGLLAPQYKEVLLGHAEVRSVFKITGAGTIAGCYVQDGKMQRNAQVRLLRDNVVMFTGKLSSLKHYKEDVKEIDKICAAKEKEIMEV